VNQLRMSSTQASNASPRPAGSSGRGSSGVRGAPGSGAMPASAAVLANTSDPDEVICDPFNACAPRRDNAPRLKN
jgi:hypothetical protein